MSHTAILALALSSALAQEASKNDGLSIGHGSHYSLPPKWEDVKKETYSDGVKTDKGEIAPPVVGEDPKTREFYAEFIEGTKWTIKVVGTEKSATVPKGKIISQIPGGYARVKKQGEIKVVISSGK